MSSYVSFIITSIIVFFFPLFLATEGQLVDTMIPVNLSDESEKAELQNAIQFAVNHYDRKRNDNNRDSVVKHKFMKIHEATHSNINYELVAYFKTTTDCKLLQDRAAGSRRQYSPRMHMCGLNDQFTKCYFSMLYEPYKPSAMVTNWRNCFTVTQSEATG